MPTGGGGGRDNNDSQRQTILPPGSFNPFCMPTSRAVAHLCWSTSHTRLILVGQLAGLRALTVHWLHTRLGSRVSKTQGKTEHTMLVHTNRIFFLPQTTKVYLFSVWFTVEPVGLSPPAEQHRKGKLNQVKANIALPRFPQRFFLSGMSKLWKIKQPSRCAILKL